MKKLGASLFAKIIAFFLAFLSGATAIVSFLGCIFLAGSDAYLDGGINFISRVEREIASNDLSVIHDYAMEVYNGNVGEAERYAKLYLRENSNIIFTVTDGNGNIVVSNGTAADGSYRCRYTNTYGIVVSEGERRKIKEYFESEDDAYFYLEEELYKNSSVVVEGTSIYNLNGETVLEAILRDVVNVDFNYDIRILKDLSAKDFYFYVLSFADLIVDMRYALIIISVVSAVFTLVFSAFLMYSAGKRKDYDGVYVGYGSKIPFDVVLFFGFILIGVPIAFINEASYTSSDLLPVMLCVVSGIVWLTFLLYLVYTVSVRIKSHELIKNTLIYRILMLAYKAFCLIFKVTSSLLKNVPLYWKALALIAALTVSDIIFIAGGFKLFVVYWIIKTIALIPIVGYFAIMMHKLGRGARELASGNFSFVTDTKHMIPELSEHGKNLNSIGDGMKVAVERMTKSERMKAELITNVSHDIKTPLTSIVNYVDLLGREGLDSKNAPEYLSALARQSERLKKLTEDLIEASKASTGSIAVSLEKTSLNVLLSQALGEYETKFSEKRLETVLSLEEELPYIMADGRLLWRVIDNLLCNVYKYALEGTRVYISTELEQENAVVVFRNISKNKLTASGGELTERFVRGDASRNTEGSGLGLSIAEDLTGLQGGRFSVTVDGDLFKATLSFPINVSE